MKSRRFKLYDQFNHYLFAISLILTISFYFTNNSYLLLITGICGLIILCRYIVVKTVKGLIVFLILLALFVFFIIKSWHYENLSSMYDILFIFPQVGLAFYLFKGKYNNKIISIVFYLFSCYLLLQIIRGVEVAQLVIYSENIANFIVIALGVALYYVRYINGQKLILNPAILVLLISSLTLGRTAIVASLLLLGIVIYFKYKWNFKYFLLLILIFMFYSDRVINSILTIIQNLGSKFGERTSFAEDVRYTIWADYMEKIDLTRLLLGFNEAETHYFMGFTNPHNSFLSGHYTLGFFMIVIIMLIIYILIKLSIYRHSFIALLLVVLLVRSSTDMVIFTGNFDFIYISILLYGYFLMKGELKLE